LKLKNIKIFTIFEKKFFFNFNFFIFVKKNYYEMKFIFKTTIICLFLFLFCYSCGNDEEENTPSGPYYSLSELLIEEKAPNQVNILFQVFDKKGKGVEDFLTHDFKVLEDGKTISQSESQMTIQKNGEIEYKIYTVLLIDNSMSIGDNLEVIKSSSKSMIDKITNNQYIAIYTFSENAVLIQDFTNDVSTLRSSVDKIELGASSTNLHGALVDGLNRIENIYSLEIVQEGAVIVFTDGEDTQGSVSFEQVIEARENKKIYALGLGEEINEKILEDIGNSGYYHASEVNQLVDLFQEIQDEILTYINSFYWLYYQSPKRGEKEHTLELKINSNSNSSKTKRIMGEFNSKFFFSSTVYDYRFSYMRNDLNLTSKRKGTVILKKEKTTSNDHQCDFIHIGELNNSFEYDLIFADELPNSNNPPFSDYYENGSFKEGIIGYESILQNNYNVLDTLLEMTVSGEALNKNAIILFRDISGNNKTFYSSGLLEE